MGDEFIREGIISFFDEIFKSYEPLYVNKHDLSTLHRPVENEITPVNDKFLDAHIIVQSGAPVYWNLNENKCYKIDWAEELWYKRIYKLADEKLILNIAAGSCQPYPDIALSYTSDPQCADFAIEAAKACHWTSARDPLASQILYALNVDHDLLPCAALHAARRVKYDSNVNPNLLGVNLMPFGGHLVLKEDVRDTPWNDMIHAFLQDFRKRHSILFIAHDEKEKEFMEQFRNSNELIFHSPAFRDYLPVYARCSVVLANRVHGAVCAAGFGRPSVIVGNDSRLLIGSHIGIPVRYVAHTEVEEIVSLVENAFTEREKERDRLLELKRESAHIYINRIQERMEDFLYWKRGAVKTRKNCRKSDAIRVKLASVKEINSLPFRNFMAAINLFAREYNLKEHTSGSKVWEYPWLWYNAFCGHDWRKTSILDIGSGAGPIPWLTASFGAKVTLVEKETKFVDLWEEIVGKGDLKVDWRIVKNEILPFENERFDIVSSFSVNKHMKNMEKGFTEALRVLKKGGTLAISFDICEPEMNMDCQEWNGKALTITQFERLISNMDSLNNGTKQVEWNIEEIADFIKWRMKSTPHHNYTIGAAVLKKVN